MFGDERRQMQLPRPQPVAHIVSRTQAADLSTPRFSLSALFRLYVCFGFLANAKVTLNKTVHGHSSGSVCLLRQTVPNVWHHPKFGFQMSSTYRQLFFW